MTRVRPTHTQDGRRIEVSHVLEAPAADAWELLVDTTEWPSWSPLISGVESSDRRIRTGTTGRVRLSGVWTSFHITTCADRRWTWTLSRLPGATHRVDDLERNRCRIAFELPVYAAGSVPVTLRALENLEVRLVE